MQQAPDHDLDIASKEQRLKELAQERRAEQATSRPPAGHQKATSKPQQATSRPPAGHQRKPKKQTKDTNHREEKRKEEKIEEEEITAEQAISRHRQPTKQCFHCKHRQFPDRFLLQQHTVQLGL